MIELIISQDEILIIGAWIYSNDKMLVDDNCKRIDWLINNQFRKVSTSPDGWETIYQDVNDGRYWKKIYPQGELQGGGPPTLQCVTLRELYGGMTVNERLYIRGLSKEFDNAVSAKDTEQIKSILNNVGITDESNVNAIINYHNL